MRVTGPGLAGATDRTQAEHDRATALADRESGASERTHAKRDRSAALADREASAWERAHASTDDLTRVYRRGPGFVELEREIARARRTAGPLMVAFVDINGLKAINDSRGHAAG
jgi:GGDEF domain-containing protein